MSLLAFTLSLIVMSGHPAHAAESQPRPISETDVDAITAAAGKYAKQYGTTVKRESIVTAIRLAKVLEPDIHITNSARFLLESAMDANFLSREVDLSTVTRLNHEMVALTSALESVRESHGPDLGRNHHFTTVYTQEILRVSKEIQTAYSVYQVAKMQSDFSWYTLALEQALDSPHSSRMIVSTYQKIRNSIRRDMTAIGVHPKLEIGLVSDDVIHQAVEYYKITPNKVASVLKAFVTPSDDTVFSCLGKLVDTAP